MKVKQLIEVLSKIDENMEIATIVNRNYAEQVNHVSMLECGDKKYVAIGNQSFKNINGQNGYISIDFYGRTINNCSFFTEI